MMAHIAEWRGRLPRHLQDAKILYMAGLILLCLLATLVTTLTSLQQGIRWQCGIISVALALLLIRFLMGLSVERALRIGSLLAVLHITGEALQNNQIYSSTLVWMALLPITHFHIHGQRAALRWTVVTLGSLVLATLFGIWQGDAATTTFGVAQAPTALSEYLLAALGIAVVPWIYSKRYDETLAQSQQRQHDLQAKQVELEHMLQMREHFIASVSHELRTPMNAILGLNTLLLERVQDKPQARRVLEYTRQSADHLMTVINDVLDYSQFSSGKLRAHPEVFELAVTVQAAFDLFRPQVENTALAYRCELEAGVPQWVQTDRHRLMQVLVNLLGNAIKFTHQGAVTLRVYPVPEGVEFSVRDTGIGMTPEQQAGVFERYRQAHASIQAQYGGSGLGLTISQRLVQMMGGRMGLESQVGAGSRFWFRLPLQAVAAPQPQPPATGQPPASRAQGLRFLVVDDHPVNRLLVRQALQRQWPQCEVRECEDGAKAVQALQDGQGYDLVLMDMVMPVMDGIEATRRIRAHADERTRRTPVLGLTANVSAQDLEQFERAGLDGLLLKPFEMKRLRAEIERLVRTAGPTR